MLILRKTPSFPTFSYFGPLSFNPSLHQQIGSYIGLQFSYKRVKSLKKEFYNQNEKKKIQCVNLFSMKLTQSNDLDHEF